MPDEIKAQNLTKNPQAGQPGEKPNLAGRLALVILVLAVLAVAGYFGLKDGSQTKSQPGKAKETKPQVQSAQKNEETQEVYVAPKDRPELKRYVVFSDAKITVPKVTGVIEVSQEKLPKELQTMVLKGAENLKVEKVKYEDGSAGYRTSYTMSGDASFDYNKIQNKFYVMGGSTMTYARNVEEVGVVEYTGGEYQVQGLWEKQTSAVGNSYHVTVAAIKK